MDDLSASNPIANTPSPLMGGKKIIQWLKGPKIIFIILGLVVLVEVVLAVKNLKQTPTASPPKVAQPISEGKIVLASPQKEFKIGETVPVSVRISTGGHPTDGTDLVLKYDPKILEASSAAIKKGTIYQDYPITAVNARTGMIQISGIASVDSKGFNGVGVFATIQFKAKAAGSVNLMVEAKENSTTDSNIIETGSGKDLLNSSSNLDLTVK